jgi:hypothetical protein
MNRTEKLREKQLNEFMDDVKNHTMKVIKDDFPYCHLEFSNKGSSIYKFSIITAPGTILIKGALFDSDTYYAFVQSTIEFMEGHSFITPEACKLYPFKDENIAMLKQWLQEKRTPSAEN